MTDTKALHRKLQLRAGASLWVWPETGGVPESLVATEDFVRSGAADADVALLLTEDRASVDNALSEHLGTLSTAKAVWIVYAKGNRTDINRDTLWIQLAQYGWRAVSQVSFSETHSALRVRPLKEGEVPRSM